MCPFRRPFEARSTDGSRRALYKVHLALKKSGPWVAPIEIPPGSPSTWRLGRPSTSAQANSRQDQEDKAQDDKKVQEEK